MFGAGNQAWDAWKHFSDDPLGSADMPPDFHDDPILHGRNVQAKFNYRMEQLARIRVDKLRISLRTTSPAAPAWRTVSMDRPSGKIAAHPLRQSHM